MAPNEMAAHSSLGAIGKGNGPMLAAFVMLMLACTSFSGCIDVELARNIFVQDEQARLVYINKVYTYSYSFTTEILEPTTIEFSEVFDIPIKNDTTYLDTIVSVSIPALPDVGDEIGDIIENFSIERYVRVEIFNPLGEIMNSVRVNYTTVHPIQLARVSEPTYGNWKLKIEGQGIGITAIDLHDTFSVRLTAHEPKYEI
jgi:hypothetical protein